MASQARGLQNFISDLRNAKGKVRGSDKFVAHRSNVPIVIFLWLLASAKGKDSTDWLASYATFSANEIRVIV
jgi:hypothetical protein